MLKIFEDDLVRKKEEREPHGEELALILKFFQRSMQTYDVDAAQELLTTEPLVSLLIQWLMARFTDLEFEYKIAVFYSLGFLINAYDYQLEDVTHYKKLLDAMEDYEVPAEQRPSIPALVFMLPSFGVEGEMDQAQKLVRRFTVDYMKHEKMRLELVTAAQLSMAWARCRLRDE